MIRTRDYKIEQEEGNRDSGKTFRITEMASEPAEWWSIKTLQGIAAAGVELPQEVIAAGSLGIKALQDMPNATKTKAAMAILTGLAQIERGLLKELMVEMFACVSFVSSSGVERNLQPNDIEEISTRLKLRVQWLEQQFGFSLAAKPSTSDSAASEVTLQ